MKERKCKNCANYKAKDTRQKQLEQWMIEHNIDGIGRKVFDNKGRVFEINLGLEDRYFIKIAPHTLTHNLGAGAGNTITIEF